MGQRDRPVARSASAGAGRGVAHAERGKHACVHAVFTLARPRGPSTRWRCCGAEVAVVQAAEGRVRVRPRLRDQRNAGCRRRASPLNAVAQPSLGWDPAGAPTGRAGGCGRRPGPGRPGREHRLQARDRRVCGLARGQQHVQREHRLAVAEAMEQGSRHPRAAGAPGRRCRSSPSKATLLSFSRNHRGSGGERGVPLEGAQFAIQRREVGGGRATARAPDARASRQWRGRGAGGWTGHAMAPVAGCAGYADAIAVAPMRTGENARIAARHARMRIVLTEFARTRLFPRESRRNTIRDITAETVRGPSQRTSAGGACSTATRRSESCTCTATDQHRGLHGGADHRCELAPAAQRLRSPHPRGTAGAGALVRGRGRAGRRVPWWRSSTTARNWRSEGTAIDADWGVVGCLYTMTPEELPMAPITMLQQRAGREEGGSGVPLDREAHRRSVAFWSTHANWRG